jgi:hypothetical protein
VDVPIGDRVTSRDARRSEHGEHHDGENWADGSQEMPAPLLSSSRGGGEASDVGAQSGPFVVGLTSPCGERSSHRKEAVSTPHDESSRCAGLSCCFASPNYSMNRTSWTSAAARGGRQRKRGRRRVVGGGGEAAVVTLSG